MARLSQEGEGSWRYVCSMCMISERSYVWVVGKFLPFKTPLSSRYSDIPEGNKFDISMLLSYMEAMRLQMGLVIDLTKTDRFYDKRSLTERGIGHYKLRCEGLVVV